MAETKAKLDLVEGGVWIPCLRHQGHFPKGTTVNDLAIVFGEPNFSDEEDKLDESSEWQCELKRPGKRGVSHFQIVNCGCGDWCIKAKERKTAMVVFDMFAESLPKSEQLVPNYPMYG